MSANTHDEKALRSLWAEGLGVDTNADSPDRTYKPSDRTVGNLLAQSLFPTTPHAGGGAASGSTGTAATAPRFEVVDVLGQGGMGVVYRARQASLGREIAVKKVRAGSNLGTQEKFLGEALVTARLEHPNVVPVHDVSATEDGELALSMKLVRGRSWKQLLHPEGGAAPRPLDEHLEVLRAVCNAVAFAHSKGLAHCDLKPENVMVGEFGEVLLMDWGVAVDFRDTTAEPRVAPARVTLTKPCGTPSYMSPELAVGDGPRVGPWTDVYLLGAILHEIVTGRPPHQKANVVSSVMSAYISAPIRYDESVPPELGAICHRAMARVPENRYPTVAALQAALGEFRQHRESLTLSAAATAILGRAQGGGADAHGESLNRLYADLAEAAAGFRQALVLWPDNAAARDGEARACSTLAEVALEHGDLGLAEAQVARLEADAPETRRLAAALAEATSVRRRAARMGRLLRRGLTAAVVVIVVGLTTGLLLIRAAQRRATSSAELAADRLTEIRALSDLKRLVDVRAQAETLRPAVPENVPRMEAWLSDARALVSRLERHRNAIAELRRVHGQRGDGGAGAWSFPNAEEQWEHDTLADLVGGLERFAATVVPTVERRLAFARTVRAETLERHRPAWERAVASIASTVESPRYGGLRITPQLGLVPLGRDPDSGLWEFGHLESGALAVRSSDGKLHLTDDSGVVLVLLPGGRFEMGVAPPADRRGATTNVDPQARPDERPVHTVELAPFFAGKYEFTQGQWLRASGTNPSAYPAGRVVGGRTTTLLHPVEQVLWEDSHRVLGGLGLTLPTEAQWEYATRGGTTTRWWTGDQPASLQGALNIADRYCKEHGGPGSWSFEVWLDDGYVIHAPVGSYRPNPFGLHDTAGNVWEWCEDHFGPYTLPVRPGTGERLVPTDEPRVFRGGGFRASVVHAKSADRYSLYAPNYLGYDIGLRAARLVDP